MTSPTSVRFETDASILLMILAERVFGRSGTSHTPRGLLIGELTFGGASEADDHVKVAVLAGSVTTAVLAAILLRIRNKHDRDLWEEQNMDTNQNTIQTTIPAAPRAGVIPPTQADLSSSVANQ